MDEKTKIMEPESIFGYGDEEKMKSELWLSPKIGVTFVKLYNPFTSKGMYLHRNGRTKYVCFDCRFYKAPKLPEVFESFKSHVLELPVYTAFQKLKKIVKDSCIKQNIPFYIVIHRTNRYKFYMKRLTKDDFYFSILNDTSFKDLPAYSEEIKIIEEDML